MRILCNTRNGLLAFLLSGVVRASIAAIALTACISGQQQAYPLYPHTGPPVSPEQLAHLSGYVQLVDGRDVSSLGTSFDLLPGCHEVQTPLSYGHSELNAGSMYMKTGHVVYSMTMKAGYSYVIKANVEKTGGHTYGGQLEAFEKNAQGEVTRTLNPLGRRD